MLSSDKNVETIAQLIEVLKHYLGLQTEYLKLDVIDKVVRLLKAATLALIFILIIISYRDIDPVEQILAYIYLLNTDRRRLNKHLNTFRCKGILLTTRPGTAVKLYYVFNSAV